MSTNKVKGKKMDSNLVSAQRWEISYVACKFGISPEQVRELRKKYGKGRRKLYKVIRAVLSGDEI